MNEYMVTMRLMLAVDATCGSEAKMLAECEVCDRPDFLSCTVEQVVRLCGDGPVVVFQESSPEEEPL